MPSSDRSQRASTSGRAVRGPRGPASTPGRNGTLPRSAPIGSYERRNGFYLGTAICLIVPSRSNCLVRGRVYPSRVVLHLRPWQSAADELEAFVRDPFAVAAHVVDPAREHESGNEARAASVTCRFNGGRLPSVYARGRRAWRNRHFGLQRRVAVQPIVMGAFVRLFGGRHALSWSSPPTTSVRDAWSR